VLRHHRRSLTGEVRQQGDLLLVELSLCDLLGFQLFSEYLYCVVTLLLQNSEGIGKVRFAKLNRKLQSLALFGQRVLVVLLAELNKAVVVSLLSTHLLCLRVILVDLPREEALLDDLKPLSGLPFESRLFFVVLCIAQVKQEQLPIAGDPDNVLVVPLGKLDLFVVESDLCFCVFDCKLLFCQQVVAALQR